MKKPSLKSFYKLYEGLIDVYDMQSPISFYENEEQIINILSSLKNRDTVLLNSLNYAIQNNCNIVESLQICKDEDMPENAIQRYFKDINDIYEKNGNDYDIEFTEENKDKLIEMNLKTVISIAKKYQGLGLSLDDLIGAGNVGLCIASQRYNNISNKLKNSLLKKVDNFSESITNKILTNELLPLVTYGTARKKLIDYINSKEKFEKKNVIAWINKNITNAKFNSVAAMWIRAYIIIEINNNSRLVRKPKVEIDRDKDNDERYAREKLVYIDAPITDKDDTPISEVFLAEDKTPNSFDKNDTRDQFKENLRKLLTGISVRNARIILKKFGIGIPRPMLPKEIANEEGLSIARISQILQQTIDAMKENAKKYNINEDQMFEALTIII